MQNARGQSFRRAFMTSACIMVLSAPSFAEPYSVIQTPPDSAIASISGEDALHQLVLASLVASNCEPSALTKGDAGLLAGTAQTMAQHMAISTDLYFSNYVYPAMAKIAAPGSCDQFADTAQGMLENLKALGGTVVEE